MKLILKDDDNNIILNIEARNENQLTARIAQNLTFLTNHIEARNETLLQFDFSNDGEERALMMQGKRLLLTGIHARLRKHPDPSENDPEETSAFFSMAESVDWKTRIATLIFKKSPLHPDLT